MEKNNDMSRVINEIADEINSVLSNRKADKYFQGIILLYSFVENLIKWLVYVKILWEKAGEDDQITRTVDKMKLFCKRLTFSNALGMAFAVGLIDMKLYEKLDSIRQERNDIIHQLWIFAHRTDLRVLRKKLEKLARVANSLVEIFNKLVEEIGVEEVYKITL